MKQRTYTGYFVDKPRREKRPVSWRRVLLHYPLVILTILLCAVLLLCYCAPWVDPERAVWFAFLGLATPVVYLVTLVAALYWVMRWNGWFFLPLAVLLLGAGYVPRFFHPVLRKHYEQPADRDALKVMSYNVRGFLSLDKGGKSRSNMIPSTAFIAEFQPDILCLQEFQATPSIPIHLIDSMLASMPYKAVNYAIEYRNGGGLGVAVYSRWPIVAWGEVSFEGTTNSSLWADIRIDHDTIRVLNNHMQTTQINSSDYEFIMAGHAISDDESSRRHTRDILSKLAANYRRRARQADTLALLIGQAPRRTIVCGDFNDTPVSYTYRVMRGEMKDAFCEKGRDNVNTYQGFYSLFRIDYLFHTEDLTAISYQSPKSEFSDHNPVIVEIKLE